MHGRADQIDEVPVAQGRRIGRRIDEDAIVDGHAVENAETVYLEPAVDGGAGWWSPAARTLDGSRRRSRARRVETEHGGGDHCSGNNPQHSSAYAHVTSHRMLRASETGLRNRSQMAQSEPDHPFGTPTNLEASDNAPVATSTASSTDIARP